MTTLMHTSNTATLLDCPLPVPVGFLDCVQDENEDATLRVEHVIELGETTDVLETVDDRRLNTGNSSTACPTTCVATQSADKPKPTIC